MRSLLRAALVFLALLGIQTTASANIDIFATSDVVYGRDWYGGGADHSTEADASPNVVNHDYSYGSGTSRWTTVTFALGSFSVPVADIVSATFNFKIESIWTQGRDDVGSFSGGGSVLNSGGAGWKSFDITKSFIDTLNSPATSISFTLNYTGYSGFTFGSIEGGVPAYLSIAAVPEPETYAMLMAGLGLMGFVARRRKQSQA